MNLHFHSDFSNLLGQVNTHFIVKLCGKLVSISIRDQLRTSFANIFESNTVSMFRVALQSNTEHWQDQRN